MPQGILQHTEAYIHTYERISQHTEAYIHIYEGISRHTEAHTVPLYASICLYMPVYASILCMCMASLATAPISPRRTNQHMSEPYPQPASTPRPGGDTQHTRMRHKIHHAAQAHAALGACIIGRIQHWAHGSLTSTLGSLTSLLLSHLSAFLCFYLHAFSLP